MLHPVRYSQDQDQQKEDTTVLLISDDGPPRRDDDISSSRGPLADASSSGAPADVVA
ncbi:hypothetical protein IMZ48_18320 [Candidatus Bathyarchaeota archaeon]|nr:hypothetical protein [Candidatus Bathyarchaeota archaeon]